MNSTTLDSDFSSFDDCESIVSLDHRLLSGGTDDMTPEEKIKYHEDMSAEFEIFVIFMALFLG